ncbi:hypothetical protein J2847_006433 [Azospirillum agricola]|uniref:DUF3164 family protein n=1 Tax=Azospirillum agricola TaxID=1720247 RepID=UPI001AE3E7D6|nr:DUF3164 family protein [Azospirillum agricola]MBP2233098.1 hypothetical protein [Azospirillum agricola]
MTQDAQKPAETADPPAYYEDAKGRMIPARLVKATDLLEDQLVRELLERAESLAATLAAFKAGVFNDVGAFLAILADQYDAKRGGKKGNLTFTSFDGKLKVQVAVADHLTFGPELQVAKQLIDECIGEWGKDANDNIRVLVDHAFRVDKEGQVSRESVFALRRVSIADARWARAMEAIADSIRVAGTKTYVRFYHRDTPESSWRSVTLDLANA